MLQRKSTELKNRIEALNNRLFLYSRLTSVEFPKLTIDNVFTTIAKRPVHRDYIFQPSRSSPLRHLSPSEDRRHTFLIDQARGELAFILKRQGVIVTSIDWSSIRFAILEDEVFNEIMFDVTHEISSVKKKLIGSAKVKATLSEKVPVFLKQKMSAFYLERSLVKQKLPIINFIIPISGSEL